MRSVSRRKNSLQRRTERHGRHLGSGETHNGAVEILESVLRDYGRDLAAHPEEFGVLVHDEYLAGLLG